MGIAKATFNIGAFDPLQERLGDLVSLRMLLGAELSGTNKAVCVDYISA
jgi:hypothetical protein